MLHALKYKLAQVAGDAKVLCRSFICIYTKCRQWIGTMIRLKFEDKMMLE